MGLAKAKIAVIARLLMPPIMPLGLTGVAALESAHEVKITLESNQKAMVD